MTLRQTQSPKTTPVVSDTVSRRRRRLAVWLATGFGVGYLPVMPGTYGSALGVALYLGLERLGEAVSYPRLVVCSAVVGMALVAVAVVSRALKSFQTDDPQPIVLDEVAGQLIALAPLVWIPAAGSASWKAILAGFLLFRALDAAKPYPIWKLDRLKGAWGVVGDDLAAGALAAVLLAGLLRLGWVL